ncbi:hypothetical protein RRG08_005856 [Elysia crispata]|uniref:Uncharacterized protein n=1 Tax=Elysia crispata TaxID=231223 RepID=A0AAE1CJ89_9GAST|nr:hypothetical protein RRG08_005856 [Elysia crispata]
MALIKTSIETSRQYDAIAAVTTQTLAVGYASHAGIDLIDLSGRILRQISSTLYPWSMLTTPDGFLMMSSYRDNSIAKMKLEDQTIVFDHKVKQIKCPRGVSSSIDGSLIVFTKFMGLSS